MAIKNTQESIIGTDGSSTTVYRQTTAANVLVHEDSTENARAHLHYYAVCGTDADTAEKAISVAGGSANVLAASVLFTIKFTNGNTAAAPQINVNGQGAKGVTGSNLNMIKAGQLVQLVYNGREFVMKDLLPVAKEETSTTTLYPVMATGEGELEETRISENMKFTKDGGLETNISESTVSWKDDTEDSTEEVITGGGSTDPIPSTQSADGIAVQTADPAAASNVEEFTSGKTTSALFKIIKKIFTGLGSAAFTDSTDYATAAQGAKADTALQKSNLFDGVTYATAGENALDAHTGLTLQNQISDLSSKVTSFENTKSTIVGSDLGKALSMSTSITWSDLVSKIKGVVNKGAVSSSLNCGGSYTIPAGYHNGSGKITANSLSSQTSATAAAGNILSGKTAYVNGSKITGNMANRGNLNWSGSNTTYSVPAGYYSGGTLDSRTSYNNGRNQGRTDVKNSPNSYGLYTKSQYDGNYNSGYNAGTSAKASKVWTAWIDTTAGGYWNCGFEPHFILVKRRDDRLPIGVYSNYGSYFNYMVGPSNSYHDGAFSTNGSGFSLTSNLSNYTKDKGCYAAAIRIV